MPKDSQAQADLTEEPLVDDPLDASNVPDEGATELDNYFNEVDGLDMGEEEGQAQAAESESLELPQETFVDEEEPGDGEEQESEDKEDEPAEEAEESDQDEEEEDEPAATATPERFRIRAKDEVETEALAMRKRHPDWSLKECIEKAEQVLGVAKAADTQAEQEDDTPTVATISEQIKALQTKRKEASLALEFETAEEFQEQIDALRDQREELRYQETEQKSVSRQREAEEFEQAFSQSETKAVRFYPDTAKPDSELVKRMIELDERLLANGDPVYDSPDKPFILAKAAAKELGIIMADPNAPAKKPAVKKSSQGSRPIQPASGSARTTAAAPTRRLDDALDSMESLEDYDSLVEAL